MKKYPIIDVTNTIQGEGTRAGSRAVFLRLGGCNMWSGRPQDRGKGAGACAMWCDTEFFNGRTLMTAEEIVAALNEQWPGEGKRWVVLTGGEPLLTIDQELVRALRDAGWSLALETNGSIATPSDDFDHVCVSPKLTKEGTYDFDSLKVTDATEYKVVLPGIAAGRGWSQEMLEELKAKTKADHYYLQPQDVTDPTNVEISFLKNGRTTATSESRYKRHLADTVQMMFVLDDGWQLSLQTQKYIDMP